MPGLNDIKKLRCQTSPRARVETAFVLTSNKGRQGMQLSETPLALRPCSGTLACY
jgi:hypothetical protein